MYSSRHGHFEPSERDARCRHCYITGTVSEVTTEGPHHTVAQGCFRRGFVAENDGRMCCPRAEGAAFKCGKYKCPCEFIVMWGFVWKLEPDRMMRFAARGRDHSVNPRCSHHDFPCDMDRNGMRSIYQIVQQENEKARRIFLKVSERTDKFAEKFSIVAHRLVEMLPYVENNRIVQLGSPAFLLPSPSEFVAFNDQASHEDSAEALNKQRERSDCARYALQSLVRRLHVVRCLRDQIGCQRMESRRYCVDKVLSFLGRAAFSPQISGFAYEEVQAPVVIQEVQHPDPPTTIDGQLASLHLQHKLADNVMALSEINQSRSSLDEERENTPKTEQIHLLEYNRHPEAFRSALSEGAPLRECRAALEEAGCKWLLGSGAKIFVHPNQYASALVAIVEHGIDLRPFHVIVAESFEYQVEACLADLSYRQGARVKRRSVIQEVPAAEESAEPSEEISSIIPGMDDDIVEQDLPTVVKKTFICVAPLLRNPTSVTQSTTEAHSGGVNPRRVCPASWSD